MRKYSIAIAIVVALTISASAQLSHAEIPASPRTRFAINSCGVGAFTYDPTPQPYRLARIWQMRSQPALIQRFV